MSFALRSATRALPRAAVNTTTRAFSSTVVYQKTATQTVKDGVKSVDQAVSSKIVDGIDAAGKQQDLLAHCTAVMVHWLMRLFFCYRKRC